MLFSHKTIAVLSELGNIVKGLQLELIPWYVLAW